MKTFTFTSKIIPNTILIITAESLYQAKMIVCGLGLDLEDWNY